MNKARQNRLKAIFMADLLLLKKTNNPIAAVKTAPNNVGIEYILICIYVFELDGAQFALPQVLEISIHQDILFVTAGTYLVR
ncbi:MAG: hypothetical protein PHG69_03855 [Candidatus Omnitrophica bacterium]|nr:hypothetical protein [Candidatus Omnitrophota bacterium]